MLKGQFKDLSSPGELKEPAKGCMEAWDLDPHLSGLSSWGVLLASPTCIGFGDPVSHGKNRFLQKEGSL